MNEQDGESWAIAIIGMAGRFPGAGSVEELWELLKQGNECLSILTDEELRAGGVPDPLIADPKYVRALMRLAGLDLFDAEFFGYSPRQAESLDPQQRLFLECAWQALEAAGHSPAVFDGSIGVFAGCGINSYLLGNPSRIWTSPDLFETLLDSEKDYLASRTSYKLSLTGPSINVQTACSSSLVAVHLACQSLLALECDMALAGGVSAECWSTGYVPMPGGIRSHDGHCRAYDADATGLVGGSGVGIVALRRLADALADGDQIHAVIRSTAVNNDGSRKAGFTAPGLEGQKALLASALELAGLGARDIGMVEGHGTGTTLGDAIELTALSEVYSAQTRDARFCALGSIKTNVGHLDAAAGVTGLIKAALCVREGVLVPSLHFRRPNAVLDTESSPFYVNTELKRWPGSGGARRRAGVNSFGIGGTNAHVIVEEPPVRAREAPRREHHLIPLSARTSAALRTISQELGTCLMADAKHELRDVAFTLQTGRTPMRHRRVVVAGGCEELAVKLLMPDAIDGDEEECEQADRPVVMLFPGQGTAVAGAAAGLYRECENFRRHLDRCIELLGSTGEVVHRLLCSPPSRPASAPPGRVSQPALVAFQYSIGKLWLDWGVRPACVVGHSLGEYAAACLAGALSLQDVLSLATVRGALLDELPPGRMVAARMSEEEARNWLGDGASLACVNTSSQCVLSGSVEAIARLGERLREAGIDFNELDVARAFHSDMVDGASAQLLQAAQGLKLEAPEIPYIKGVTGRLAVAGVPLDTTYWARHLRETVRFAAATDTAAESFRGASFLEVGPGCALTNLARKQLTRHDELAFVAPPAEGPMEELQLLRMLGRLWLKGTSIDWKRLHAGTSPMRVSLPTYPFERKRYWIDRPLPGSSAGRDAGLAPAGGRLPLDRWFHASTLRGISAPPLVAANVVSSQPWIVVSEEGDLAALLAARLLAAGADVTGVQIGAEYAECADGSYRVNREKPGEFHRLFARLRTRGKEVRRAIYLVPADAPLERLSQDTACLMSMAQALVADADGEPMRLVLVGAATCDSSGGGSASSNAAAAGALCRVLTQEHANVQCCTVDVPRIGASDSQKWRCGLYADWIIREAASQVMQSAVVYRGRWRFVRREERIALPEHSPPLRRLRERGTYLITGGLGAIGLMLAEHLAGACQARLVLVTRSALPTDVRRMRVMERIQRMEEAGAEVAVEMADVANPEAMQAVIERAHARFGALHGVFHLAMDGRHRSIRRAFRELESADIEAQLLPKVAGWQVLDRLLRNRSLDFRVAFSSNAAALGGFGFAAYAAANAAVESLVEQCTGPESGWIAIGWDGWKVSLQSEADWPEDPFALDPNEAFAALFRIIEQAPVPCVHVSSMPLDGRIATWVENKATAPGPGRRDELQKPTRDGRRTSFVAPRTRFERTIVEVWENVLGVSGIGVKDDFLDLGGDSLTGLRVRARLQELFHVEVPVNAFIGGHATIEALATQIVALLASCEDIPATELDPRPLQSEELGLRA